MRCLLCGLDGATRISNIDGLIGAACLDGPCGGLVWERSILDGCRAGRTWRSVHAWEARRQHAAANWLFFDDPPPVSLLPPRVIRVMKRAAT